MIRQLENETIRAVNRLPKARVMAGVSVLLLMMCVPVAMASSSATIVLDSTFQVQEKPKLDYGKPITVKAEGIDSKYVYAEAMVKLSGVEQGTTGAPIKGGVWTVSIGPFPFNSTIELSIRAVGAIAEDEVPPLRETIRTTLATKVEQAVFRDDGSWTVADYTTLVHNAIIDAVTQVAGSRNLRGSAGQTVNTAVSGTLTQTGTQTTIEGYTEALETVQPDNLWAAFGMLADLKNHQSQATYTTWKSSAARDSDTAFWTQLEGVQVPGPNDSQVIAATTVLPLCEALAAANDPLAASSVSTFCSTCPSYKAGLNSACANLSKARKDESALLDTLMVSIGGTLQTLAVFSTSTAELEIRDIEYWTGFELGYLNLSDSEEIAPFFLIDIHPARIEMGGPGVGTGEFWNKNTWWKHFSLSVGFSLSELNFGESTESAYFLGLGFRLNPYLRIHAGQSLIDGKIGGEHTRVKDWSYGVSINVREIAHVMGLFSGIPETFKPTGD